MYFPHPRERGLSPCDRKHYQKTDFPQQLPQGLPQWQGNIHLHISLLLPVLHTFGDRASCKCLAISTQPRTSLRAIPASELPAKLAKYLLHLNFIFTYSSAQFSSFTTVKHSSHDTSSTRIFPRLFAVIECQIFILIYFLFYDSYCLWFTQTKLFSAPLMYPQNHGYTMPFSKLYLVIFSLNICFQNPTCYTSHYLSATSF